MCLDPFDIEAVLQGGNLQLDDGGSIQARIMRGGQEQGSRRFLAWDLKDKEGGEGLYLFPYCAQEPQQRLTFFSRTLSHKITSFRDSVSLCDIHYCIVTTNVQTPVWRPKELLGIRLAAPVPDSGVYTCTIITTSSRVPSSQPVLLKAILQTTARIADRAQSHSVESASLPSILPPPDSKIPSTTGYFTGLAWSC